jgi:uncharacterized protein (TIGR02145 family)
MMANKYLSACFITTCIILIAIFTPAGSQSKPTNISERNGQQDGSGEKPSSDNPGTIDTSEKKEGKVIDTDGNTYKTILIGKQTWMAENLKTTKFNDGTPIPLTEDPNAWNSLTTPGYSWYDNNTANKDTYGALYNWYTVTTGKLCPIQWHVPSDSEISLLADYLGGPAIAGGKLKESGIIHWQSPNKWATNESGFSALPGGYRDYVGRYFYIGSSGSWWSTTEYFASSSWSWYVHSAVKDFIRNISGKNDGYSVRCVKDF